jgi:hypothetical protein
LFFVVVKKDLTRSHQKARQARKRCVTYTVYRLWLLVY